ncbi:MAG: hypothetical protein QG656_1201 [Candidatus Hydrogenedentes bacterium]|nr:hypothetical protein [Candidatus Hydrogenedentota bacterium]
MREQDSTTDRTTIHVPKRAAEGVGKQRASLIVISGWEIGREIPLSARDQVFGRSVLATTRIVAPSVSREHARIALIDRGGERFYELTDLRSRNGTCLNNEPIETARLEDGDKVQMGEVVFKFAIQDDLDAQFHQDIHRLINYDQLTGLLTMEAFSRRLQVEIHKKRTFTLAMTDLDGLKRVNDTYGHPTGSNVVREMGAMMRATLRDQDFAALYGGDETIVLFPETSIAEAREVAERIRKTIESRVFESPDETFSVTISQGLAEWPRHGATADDVVAAADAALYAAKDDGRNCVRCAGD